MAVAGCCTVLLWHGSSAVRAQPAPDNRVLELDGNGSHVELPAALYERLDEVTVEGWIKWTRFGNWSRFFDFGTSEQEILVGQVQDDAGVNFVIRREPRYESWVSLRIPDLIQPNEWCHIAAVAGRGAMKLYFNGYYVGGTDFGGAVIRPENARNFLGKSNFPVDTDFSGQMDEVRVWKVARTEEQIRQSMHGALPGDQDGLIGYWPFDAGDARDVSSAGMNGVLHGNARCAVAPLPEPSSIASPALLRGRVLLENGLPARAAEVRILQEGLEIGRVKSDTQTGEYRIAVFHPRNQPCELSVVWAGRNVSRRGVQLEAGSTLELNLSFGDYGSLSGSLRMFDRTPHVAVPVQLLGDSNQVIRTQLSDGAGAYVFTNVPPGKYRVRCQVLGGFRYHGLDRVVHGGSLTNAGPEVADVPALTLQAGAPIENASFTIAPFKKGTWETFNVASGLASDTDIRKILVEPNGLVWFASRGGVSRYDGQKVVTLTTDDGLVDNYVMNMDREPNGVLWFTTQRGVSRLDGKKFANFTAEEGLMVGDNIDGVYAAPNGVVWFSGSAGVARFDGRQFTNFNRTNGLPGRVMKITSTPDGSTVWMASTVGLLRCDGTNFVNVTKEAGLKEFGTDSPHVAPDGKVWFGSFGVGAWSFDGASFVNYTTKNGLPDNQVNGTYSTPDGAVWFATRGGISRFDGTRFVNFTKEDGLSHNGCIFVTGSPDGVMWFGTINDGAARYDGKAFASFTAADGVGDNRVSARLAAPDGALWFGHSVFASSLPREFGASRFDGGNSAVSRNARDRRMLFDK